LKVLARSSKALLLWVPGHAYWSGRQQNYGAASLYLIDTRKTDDVYRHYKELKDHSDGGRLSAARILASAAKIDAVFGDGAAQQIAETVKAKQTNLIDGGGDPLTPSHRELRRRRRVSEPPQPKPPRVELIGMTEEQVDRLMDAARERLENANDELGQVVWRNLELLKRRFQPRAHRAPVPVLEGPLRLD
jgi:hypothetical protein